MTPRPQSLRNAKPQVQPLAAETAGANKAVEGVSNKSKAGAEASTTGASKSNATGGGEGIMESR